MPLKPGERFEAILASCLSLWYDPTLGIEPGTSLTIGGCSNHCATQDGETNQNSSYKIVWFEHTILSVGVEVNYPYTIDSSIRYNGGRTCSVLMINVTRRQICRAKPRSSGNQASFRSNRLDNIAGPKASHVLKSDHLQ